MQPSPYMEVQKCAQVPHLNLPPSLKYGAIFLKLGELALYTTLYHPPKFHEPPSHCPPDILMGRCCKNAPKSPTSSLLLPSNLGGFISELVSCECIVNILLSCIHHSLGSTPSVLLLYIVSECSSCMVPYLFHFLSYRGSRGGCI